MSTEIVRASEINLDELQRIAKMMVVSGYFDAAKDLNTGIAQMAIKVMAGREMGYGPFASVQGIHIIQGKPSISANLMAAAVKAHPRYDYRVRQMSAEAVSIEFFENGQSLGISEFTKADADAASTQNMRKFPRNMLFARALSNGVRWYCPDVFNGNAVYVPEELGADIDGDGNFIDLPSGKVDTKTGEIVIPAQPPADDLPVALDMPPLDYDAGQSPEDNPFDSPDPLAWGEIADGLTGDCLKLAAWAFTQHNESDGPASDKQYKYLSGVIDSATNGQHTEVLSVLCRRPVSGSNPCGKKLAGKLLDFIADKSKPTYRADYVECLRNIAQAAVTA